MEGTVGTLHILAREAQSRVLIRNLKCIPLFVRVGTNTRGVIAIIFHMDLL